MGIDTFKNIPQPGDILSQSQVDLNQNMLYLIQTLGSNQPNKSPPNTLGDHQVSLNGTDNTAFEGRHLRVSLNNQNSTSLTCVDGADNTIWSSNGILYSRNTTLSGPLQLTANFTPNVTATLGQFSRTFLPGGLVLITGKFNQVSDPQTVNLVPFGFPSTCISVILTPARTTPLTAGACYTVTGVTLNSFTFATTNISTFPPWYFIAIGF